MQMLALGFVFGSIFGILVGRLMKACCSWHLKTFEVVISALWGFTACLYILTRGFGLVVK